MEEKKPRQLNLTEKIWAIKLEIPKIKKATKGFKFKYTNLGDIEKALRPLLIKRKVGYYHSTKVDSLGSNVLQTVVFDLESDEVNIVALKIPENVTLGGMNAYQSLGSGLTYFRRYNLVTAFGILTDDDVDAAKGTTTQKTAPVKINHVEKISQLIGIGRAKSTLENYYSMYQKEMSEVDKKKAMELINKVK